MKNQITYTNGTTEIKAEKINGEWNAPVNCVFPSFEMMEEFLTSQGFSVKKENEETNTGGAFSKDGLTQKQRLFKIRSNMYAS